MVEEIQEFMQRGQRAQRAADTILRTQGGGTLPKRKAFGGYGVSFAGRHDSLQKVFGSKPLPPSKMTKKLWNYIKKHRLGRS